MRIGIFGGTFNPIHLGHLIVAEEVGEKLRLDKVLFLLAFNPPHKREVADYEDRRKMVKMAIADNQKFLLSEIEKERGGKSWTVDTLQALRRVHPRDKLFLIVGSDQFNELPTWKRPEEIFNLAKVCVVRRPGVRVKNSVVRIFSRVLFLDVSQVDIRGKEIRRRIRRGISVKYLLPDKVYRYIKRKKIYQKERL